MSKIAVSAVARVADANVNRFRDGLRVIEDTLRFARGSRLYASVRRLRGDFARLFAGRRGMLVAARASGTDPGRSSAQKKHANIDELFRANFARCSEALRVLEEYARLRGSSLPSTSGLKKIRFRLYDIEKKSLGAKK
jgi:thiamine-phosphate pyrophosphorylase